MKIVFLEADNLGPDMVFDRFSELGEVTIYGQTPDELIAERIGDADAILVNKLPMWESTLKDASNLRYIGITATGTNNVDFAYTNTRGSASRMSQAIQPMWLRSIHSRWRCICWSTCATMMSMSARALTRRATPSAIWEGRFMS